MDSTTEPPAVTVKAEMARSRPRWIEPALFLIICVIGLVVRVYALRTIPPGLYNDEAAYAMDARSVVNGARAIFFEANSGREPLFIYLLAAMFALSGDNAYSVRLTAALIGALTVPATYWMVRAAAAFASTNAAGKNAPGVQIAAPWMAPWVALMLALSYWHLSLSRLGFRAITLPLILTIAAAFLFRSLRRVAAEETLPWSDLLLVGFFSGLSLYTYTAGRIVPVLVIAGLSASLLLAPRLGLDRRKLGKAAALIIVTMIVTMLPLLNFFAHHPYFFAGHAIELSVMTERYGGGNPLTELGKNAAKFVMMFFTLHDREIRHDPALRPVIDWVMGCWLVFGIILGLVNWRRFTLFFFVLWTFLLAAPSLLSAQGAPQSLRAIGMMPAVFVLLVAAMLWVGLKIAPRQPVLAMLVPLPFVLFSGILGVRDYFTAFEKDELFRMPFLVDYVELGEAIRANADDARWIIPLSASYTDIENRVETVNYVVNDPARFAAMWIDPARVSSALQDFAAGARMVNVIDLFEQPQFASNAEFLDSKRILDFLLSRDSESPQPLPRLDGEIAATNGEGLVAGSIPYRSYLLRESPDFSLPGTLRSTNVRFADHVQLAGLATGSAGNTADSDVVKQHSDERLWSVFEWVSLQPIDFDLKTSLVLLDDENHVVAQVDGMLTGDEYPVKRMWNAGETTRTYHLLEPLPGTPPGDYKLALSVYEDETGQVYPASSRGGTAAQRAILGDVELLPPLTAPVIAPQFPLTETLLGPEVGLAGFDLARDSAAPGETLGLTLYWQAAVTPTSTLSAVVELVGDTGAVVSSTAGAPGGSGYPTSAWTPGFAVRDARDLLIPASTPNGQYGLRVRLVDGTRTVGETNLGEITVGGRPRVLAQPPIEVPVDATFGDEVRLLGVNDLPAAPVVPGTEVPLTFIWQPQRTSDVPLVRSVQVLDAAGALVAQQDAIPCAAACPATSWLSGEFLVDTASLSIPALLPPGAYRVIVGWYNADSQQRLPAVSAKGAPLPDNMMQLPDLVVGELAAE